MKDINFKKFFNNKFFWEDRKYAQASMPVRLLEIAKERDISTKYMPIHLVEMAMKGQIAKTPIRIDNDDLEFLYQFPPKFWPRALHARYHDDLHQALELRQEVRAKRRENIREAVRKALVTQDFSVLRGVLPSDKIKEIEEHYGPEWAAHYKRKGEKRFHNAAYGAADDFSYYHIEDEIPNSPISEEPKLYRFKAPGSTQHIEKFNTFKAKPFINRLIHKLERTRDLKHGDHIGDELVQQLKQHGHESGQYGYDLDQVKKGRPKEKKGDTIIPNSTHGMQMPNYDTTVDQVKDLLATNAHRIHGPMPGDADYEGDATQITLPNGEVKKLKGWEPVRAGTSKDHEVGGKGNIHLFDAFIRRKHQDPLEQKYFTLLNMANGTFKTLSGKVVNPRQFGTNDEIEKEAKRLAIEDVEWLKESGTISGPPIPGHERHSQGIPFRDVEKHPDSKQIVHLPHFDHEIISVGDDGRESKETVSMPYVRPARYFRSIGVVPEDFETEEDEDGKPRIVIDANGKSKISEEARKRAVGYQKDYIPVHPDEFEGLRSATRNKGVYSGGSLDVNKNTSGLNTLDYGHHDYSRISDQVFGPDDPTESRPETAMRMFSIDGQGRTIKKKGSTGEFYQDVIAGIRKCLKGTCGGATAWERSIATNNIEDFHQFIVQQMQHNLRNPDMLTKDGRISFASNHTSKVMQQDHGSGTRRKRIRDASLRPVSMDNTTKSGETGEESSGATQDLVTQRQRDRPAFGPNDVINRKAMSGTHAYPYDIRKMRDILDSLRSEAGEADKNAIVARERSRVETGQEILQLLSRSLDDKSAVSHTLHSLFMKMFQSTIPDTPQIEEPEDNVEDGKKKKKKKRSPLELAADAAMETLAKQAKTTEQLVAAFAQHPMVQKYIDRDELPSQQTQQGDQPPADLPQALEKLEDTYLDHIPQEDGKPNPSPQMKTALTSGQVARVVANNATNDPVDREKIQKALQDHINKFLGVEAQAPVAQPTAAPVVSTQPKRPIALPQKTPVAAAARAVEPAGLLPAEKLAKETPNWRDLMSQKNYLALAFHPEFLETAQDSTLQNLRGWFEKNKAQLSEIEYSKAILNIEKEMADDYNE